MPSPLDIPHIKGEDMDGNEVEAITGDDQPFAALAFKIATDPFVGKLCFFRVYSGTLESGSTKPPCPHSRPCGQSGCPAGPERQPGPPKWPVQPFGRGTLHPA